MEDELKKIEETSYQLVLDDVDDNYFPASSDYGNIPNRFIEKYSHLDALSTLSMALALQNVTERNKKLYAGTAEGNYYEEIYQKTATDYSDGLVACFPISQFIKLFGLSTGGTTYQRVDTLFNLDTRLIDQWKILYEDKNTIASTTVLTGAMYDKKTKKIYMKFNPDTKPFIMDLKEGYTRVSLPVMGKLKSEYLINLYSLLKRRLDSEIGKAKKFGFKLGKEVKIEYEIEHFFFVSGLYPVDLSADDNHMQKVINMLRIKDYQAAARIMKDNNLIEKYSQDASCVNAINNFSYYRRSYLDKAFKKINGFDIPKILEKPNSKGFDAAYNEYMNNCQKHHPTDIHFRYEFIRSGRGAKITGIVFYLSKANWNSNGIILDSLPEFNQENVSVVDVSPAPDKLSQQEEGIINALLYFFMKDPITMIKGEEKRKITREEAIALAKDANWDTMVLKTAYDYTMDQDYDSFMAYMRAAIKNGYGTTTVDKETKTKKKTKVSKSAEIYNSYSQRNYTEEDFLELERKLLNTDR